MEREGGVMEKEVIWFTDEVIAAWSLSYAVGISAPCDETRAEYDAHMKGVTLDDLSKRLKEWREGGGVK
jgi:hypothetical protein